MYSSEINPLVSTKAVSRLALGTAQFGFPYGVCNMRGQVSLEEAGKILKLARINNINTIDTAISYGDSERCLGALGVQDLKVVTKLPKLPINCRHIYSWVLENIDQSYSRMGIRSAYGLLLHNATDLLSSDGVLLYNALANLRNEGLIEKIGISIYSPAELDLLAPHFQFDLVQAPLNLIDRRLVNSGWLQKLKDDGVEIHVRSLFLQGLLLMEANNRPNQFNAWSDLWDRWHDWRHANGTSPLKTCLLYALSFSEIDRLVVGVDGIRQFQEIINVISDEQDIKFPDIACNDELLINPSNWEKK